ncbi:MAG: hypothetical protein WBQ19_15720 [Terriglobales bacterium]
MRPDFLNSEYDQLLCASLEVVPSSHWLQPRDFTGNVQNFLPMNVATPGRRIMHPCRLWTYEDNSRKTGSKVNIFHS